MKNRGQFFLIGAFAIVVIVISLTTIYSRAATSSDDSLVFLASEITQEANRIIDRAEENLVFSDVQTLLNYYAETNPGIKIFYIYTDSNVNFLSHNSPEYFSVEYAGDSHILAEGELTSVGRTSSELFLNLADSGQRAIILHDGRAFYVLLVRDINGERFIATSY